jgi:SNF family Na+-dependent transporter
MITVKTSNNFKIIYWTLTVLFGLLMLADGLAGALHQAAAVEAIVHLGYPEYFLNIVGTAKVLGAIAIIQNKYKTIKEWAYAGFVFNTLGALGSRYFTGDTGFLLFFPLILLAIILGSYYLWKKFEESEKSQ